MYMYMLIYTVHVCICTLLCFGFVITWIFQWSFLVPEVPYVHLGLTFFAYMWDWHKISFCGILVDIRVYGLREGQAVIVYKELFANLFEKCEPRHIYWIRLQILVFWCNALGLLIEDDKFKNSNWLEGIYWYI